MTETQPEAAPVPRFYFLSNGEDTPASLDWQEGPIAVRKAIGDALNARNVAFLLGAGCSSLKVDDLEKGISTMQTLAEDFCAASLPPSKAGDENEKDQGGKTTRPKHSATPQPRCRHPFGS
jgi:hypothetical protein